ncbi:MAG: GNAT family N-acetyltransferase [Rhodothermales bacterium]|nr:GNAT family N-acetyltransferase [Rhodothermales bacterium]MBO6779290.1 GNAT family N-acetyltransferase [Rhodothermales bacterium]
MIENVTLEGANVRLEPLSLDHLDGLCEVGLQPGIWELTGRTIETRAQLLAYVEEALAGRDAGHMYPFATVLRGEDRVVGSSRFGNIALAHKRLEIGWTWVAPQWQRTFVNTEAKLLMLGYCFETLRLNRVELKTDALNLRSRRAMLGIGCTEEGTLRHHMVTGSGRLRDTVYYSILREEWPRSREILEARLRRN